MAGELKNGLEEFFGIGASVAHAARGAVKTGRAVAGAAKGAAVGGPYGAAAGTLLQYTHYDGISDFGFAINSNVELGVQFTF